MSGLWPELRAGDAIWRIGQRAGQPLRCEFMRTLPGDLVKVRSNRFAPDEEVVKATNIFPDRDSCRLEIQRRAKETSNG
jgi:hypothetical protein